MVERKIVISNAAHLAQQDFSSTVKVGFSGRLENPTTGKTPPLRLAEPNDKIAATFEFPGVADLPGGRGDLG